MIHKQKVNIEMQAKKVLNEIPLQTRLGVLRSSHEAMADVLASSPQNPPTLVVSGETSNTYSQITSKTSSMRKTTSSTTATVTTLTSAIEVANPVTACDKSI